MQEGVHQLGNNIYNAISYIIGSGKKVESFASNEKFISVLSEGFEFLSKNSPGHFLISYVEGKSELAILVDLSENGIYSIYSTTINSKLYKPLDVTLHIKSRKSITDEIESIGRGSCIDSFDKFVIMLDRSISGLTLSINKLEEFIRSIEGHRVGGIIQSTLDDIEKQMIAKEIESTKRISTLFSSFLEELDCKELTNIRHQSPEKQPHKIVGYIYDIVEYGNRRIAKIYFKYDNVYHYTLVKSSAISPNTREFRYEDRSYFANITIVGPGEISSVINKFNSIPYNYLDKGRLIALVSGKGRMGTIVVSEDPKNKEDFKETFIEKINLLYNSIEEEMTIYNAEVKDGDLTRYSHNYGDYDKDFTSSLASIKAMVDEYQYINTKKTAVGEDVFITDNINYNHKDGIIKYNDFSISTDDEILKGRLYGLFKEIAVEYYRKVKSEENILNEALDVFFSGIIGRIRNTRKEGDTHFIIKINNLFNVDIRVKVSNIRNNITQFVYINDQRINKNEVAPLLRELTCCRDVKVMEMLIKKIGRLGLSTYIGITTGYSFTNKLYKFKKEKGRSRYSLLIDTLSIPIKGKELISKLYEYKQGLSHPSERRIEEIIQYSVNNLKDFINYKVYINDSYEAFKKKSREFLDKKVKDVGASYIIHNCQGKRREAVLVKGVSGKQYAITCGDSFVFMDPEKTGAENNLDIYSDGKYICMIDQNSVKSNIGYDTVISKLLALKNDSVISGQIYNLKEELESIDEEEEDEQDKD